jgi:hypothetical protein
MQVTDGYLKRCDWDSCLPVSPFSAMLVSSCTIASKELKEIAYGCWS